MDSSTSVALFFAIIISILVILAASTLDSPYSSTAREVKALVSSGWWVNNTSDHCKWNGITCNDGRVAGISLQGLYDQFLRRIEDFDFLAFPYLARIHLSLCGLYGRFPPQIGYLSKLTYLNLSGNRLTDELPLSLANLTKLEALDISYNRIYGAIPPGIGNLKSLVALDLSNNDIRGSLPSTLGQLARLVSLILSNNQLEGVFVAEIAKLPSILMIDVSTNLISGHIPSKLGYGATAHLLSIDLSHNNLYGGVPVSLSYLKRIDLSYNDLEGPVPLRVWDTFPESSFRGNYKLLPPSHGSRIHIKTKVIFPLALFFACSVFAGCLFILYIKGKKTNQVTLDSKHGDIFKIWNYDGKIAYEVIIEATADFDLRYCIGTGGYGSVYRAELPSGRVVAVKKLHRFEGENPTYDRCFRNEAKVLSEIRHRNIVKLFGFCLHKRCMFLIYEYMERGSLFCVLRDATEAVELNWMKRVNVVEGIANALSYMHHDCSPPILHRDISSNNILLDS